MTASDDATGWKDLARELDAWAAAGRTADFWWRDDDAVAATPALDLLLGLQAEHGLPLALAVIPAAAQHSLQARLAAHDGVTPVQHGYAHRNHSRPGAQSGELGGGRPHAEILAELATGSARLAALFGPRVAPLLVPPWNRIDPGLLPALPGLGFRGLSTFGPRPAAEPAPGLRQVNTHLDIVDWRRGRGFVGGAKAVARLVEHLAARRAGTVDSTEPTGLLTHHLDHDEACWAFLAALFGHLRGHRALVWRAAASLVAPALRAEDRASAPA